MSFEPCLDRDTAPAVAQAVDQALAAAGSDVVFDLAEVDRFDAVGMAVVMEAMHTARRQGRGVQLRGMSEALREFFSLVSIERLGQRPVPAASLPAIERIGARLEPMFDALQGVLATSSEAFAGVFVGPLRGRRWRLDRLAQELDNAFIGALPIVVLIGFLLGLILAMQAFVQLRVFGADLYMADMVGVSIAYEIGPLMTGIILAARSGSSNAAQLGSMVVSEEIDALQQMGVVPLRYLVIPKILALVFTVLSLSLVFDCVAILGGAAFGHFVAEIPPNAYMSRTADALSLGSFLLASSKCAVFGWLVGVVGCGLGLRVTGGSEGVGRATTNAVVISIFLIIVVDAVFVAGQQLWPW